MELPLLSNGRILKRYKRFLADVELDSGELVVAHVPNTGRMTGCWEAGAPVQLSHSDNPRRKLAWTLERVDMGNGWIGVNTQRTNPVVEEALVQSRIAALEGYGLVEREKPPPLEGRRSRLDLFLSRGRHADAWIEVKNVTLLMEDCLGFPDAVSVRGSKHLRDLQLLVAGGCRGIILYALNRPEGACFRPAEEVDPDYAGLLREVVKQGVEVLALRLRHTETGIIVSETVPVIL
ncbi:DNA/RNA nuclease SfsA [Thiolapillus sp.]|uniref:DNA/RNA nuclease SfsA n=2 Tax=Thiolapillus sp. TaxID=2017437 RepID=UPI003AF8A3C4